MRNYEIQIFNLLTNDSSRGGGTKASPHATNSAQPAQPAASSATAFQLTDKPVAKVNGAVLTDRDLLREMLAIFPYAGQHNGFPKAQEASIRQGALEMIIFEELVYQEAGRRRLTVSPSASVTPRLSAFANSSTAPTNTNNICRWKCTARARFCANGSSGRC